MSSINILGWPLPTSSVKTNNHVNTPMLSAWTKSHPNVMPASVYTTLVGRQIHSLLESTPGVNGLDMGTSSGFLAAKLCQEGVSNVVAIDILQEALDATKILIDSLGVSSNVTYIQGNLWDELKNEIFDNIVCNPPSLPCKAGGHKMPEQYWYDGGPDGNSFIKEFIHGLPNHLSSNGVAILAHTSLADISKTIEECKKTGIDLRADDYIDFPFREFYFDVIPEEIIEKGKSRLFYVYGDQHFERVWLLSLRKTT